MMDLFTLGPPLDRLARRGDARPLWGWRERDPDYPREFALTPADVPDLIELARQFVKSLPEEEYLWSAPIHAWRALGQLGAVEAVQPLLDMQDKLDALRDDWYLEEFHDVFALIGPAAIPAIAAYFQDRTHREFPRVSAANGLCEIAKLDAASRARVVDLITGELAAKLEGQYALNGCLVGYLLDLRAKESAEVIERAFAAGIVDELVAGNWRTVRDELGVEELGLAPDQPSATQYEFLESVDSDRRPRLDSGIDRARNRFLAKKTKAKRKQQQQSRRRNRRAK
jgi:hypothetical protein